jgi:hypothetical protein
MNAQGHLAGAPIGLPANQRHEFFVFENALDDAYAIRPFGMTGSIVMIEPGTMRKQQCIQFKPANSVAPARNLPKIFHSAVILAIFRRKHRAIPRACPTEFPNYDQSL